MSLIMKETNVKDHKINIEKGTNDKINDGTFDVIIIRSGNPFPITRRIFSKRYIRSFNKNAKRKKDKMNSNRNIITCPYEDGKVEIIYNSALFYDDYNVEWNDTQLLPSYGSNKWCDERKWDK